MATILMIFLKINLPNVVQFKEYTKVNRDHAFFCSKQNFSRYFHKFLKLSNYKPTLSQPLDNLSFRTSALCCPTAEFHACHKYP